jgi:exonuclease III
VELHELFLQLQGILDHLFNKGRYVILMGDLNINTDTNWPDSKHQIGTANNLIYPNHNQAKTNYR